MKSSILASLAQLGDQWVREQRLLGMLVRICFGIAGVLWLPLSLFNITPAEKTMYVQVHYQLYLVLLTLWGYDYRRQWKRTECVLELAQQAGVTPAQVRWDQVVAAGCASLFDVLRQRAESRAWFPLAFTWVLLVSSYILLGRQVLRLIEFATTP